MAETTAGERSARWEMGGPHVGVVRLVRIVDDRIWLSLHGWAGSGYLGGTIMSADEARTLGTALLELAGPAAETRTDGEGR